MVGLELKRGDDDRSRLDLQMVQRIFRCFDADGDGGLDWVEMAALVVALNPRIKFTYEQVDDIVDQVFRCYSKGSRVTLRAFLCIYGDIAGDAHSDFDALGLSHLFRHTSATSQHKEEETVDSSLASSSLSSEDQYDSWELDYGGYAPPLELEEVSSFRWLSSPSLVSQRGEGYASEGDDVAGLSSTLDRCPSMDSSLASSSLRLEYESSELDDDHDGSTPPLRSEEMPSLRWMLSTSPDPQGEPGHEGDVDVADLDHDSSILRLLSSEDSSPGSSSLRSEVVPSELDYFVTGYAPQSECEEIVSPRWLPYGPYLSLAPQSRAGVPQEEIRSNKKRSAYSWAGIRKLTAFYGLRNLRMKNG